MMDIEKAKSIADKVEQLTLAEKRLKLFKQTKEFCDIKFSGEDGTENAYYFNLHWKQHGEDIKSIRQLYEDMLSDKIHRLSYAISML